MSKFLPVRLPHQVTLLFFLFSISVFWSLDTAVAANLVSGRYLSASGTTLVLNLTIQNPSPANLIVEQYLSPGNNIVSTSPRAIKIDASQSTVKWLFRNIQSGNLTLSIQLSAPMKGKVNAKIRYRSPDDGSFTELRISS